MKGEQALMIWKKSDKLLSCCSVGKYIIMTSSIILVILIMKFNLQALELHYIIFSSSLCSFTIYFLILKEFHFHGIYYLTPNEVIHFFSMLFINPNLPRLKESNITVAVVTISKTALCMCMNEFMAVTTVNDLYYY